MIVEAIKKLVDRGEIEADVAERCMREIMSGEATQAQTAAFLIALRVRGESPAIISAMARIMRDFAIPIEVSLKRRLIDTCGTGGDSVKTINVSTAAGLITAAAGGYVAKHGNRSFTGYCGSADFLEEVGVRIDVEPEKVAKCIKRLGFGFIYAPSYHPSMRNVAPVRREIAVRTIFNVLGPITNPARVSAQTLGVFSPHLMSKIAEALNLDGREEALIFHGVGGIDEVSIFSETEVMWLKNGNIRRRRLRPEDFGLEKARVEEIIVRSRDECVEKTLKALSGRLEREHPLTRLLLANASAALIVAGLADDLRYGADLAWQVIESGKVIKLLGQLVKETGGDESRFERRVKVTE